jgi:hypothetical protein
MWGEEIESDIYDCYIHDESEEIPETDEEMELLKQKKLKEKDKESDEWYRANANFFDKLEPNLSNNKDNNKDNNNFYQQLIGVNYDKQ